jgi:predicted transcriptional regulator
MSAPTWFRRAPVIAKSKRVRRAPFFIRAVREKTKQNPRARDFRSALEYFGLEAGEFAATLGVTRAAVCATIRIPKTSRRINQAISEIIERHHQAILSAYEAERQQIAAESPAQPVVQVCAETLRPGFMGRYNKVKVILSENGIPTLDPEFLAQYNRASNSRREDLLEEMLFQYVPSYEDAVRLSFLVRELELSWRALAIISVAMQRTTRMAKP